MTEIVATKAYAKINIFLKVCDRYDNGYHRLLMLMQEIGIYDEIELTFDNSKPFSINLDFCGEGIPVEKNLCYRAAKAFYDKYSLIADNSTYTNIKTVKNVPSQAGLGGGSSDAAAVIKLLNDHYGNPFTYEELLEMSVKLGADVPFFLTGKSCLCEGIGEQVTKLPDLSGLSLVILKPAVGVPTGECFGLCDSYRVPFDEEGYRANMLSIFGDEKLTPIERLKKASPELINDLEKPATTLVPVISDILNKVNETNPVFGMMSGSGSSVFAFYENSKAADEAISILKSKNLPDDCFVVSTVTI